MPLKWSENIDKQTLVSLSARLAFDLADEWKSRGFFLHAWLTQLKVVIHIFSQVLLLQSSNLHYIFFFFLCVCAKCCSTFLLDSRLSVSFFCLLKFCTRQTAKRKQRLKNVCCTGWSLEQTSGWWCYFTVMFVRIRSLKPNCLTSTRELWRAFTGDMGVHSVPQETRARG